MFVKSLRKQVNFIARTQGHHLESFLWIVYGAAFRYAIIMIMPSFQRTLKIHLSADLIANGEPHLDELNSLPSKIMVKKEEEWSVISAISS